MDITVRKNDLVRELQLVQGIVERKNSIPILANVLVEARGGELRVAATDLDVSLRCGCAAEVKTEGSITLSAKKLFEIARALPDREIKIRVLPDSWTQIECGSVNYKMAGLPKEDFPALPQAQSGKGVELPADAVRDLILRTSFAITAEDARYYLAGALLVLTKDGLSMIATDGHRLAYAHRKAPLKLTDAIKVLVPRKAIHELATLLEGESSVTFQQVDNHLVFGVGDRTLASKTIDGQFPSYEKVIEMKGDKVVTIPREPFATAIRRVSLVSSERNRAVRVTLAKGTVELLASSPDLGEARETIPIDYAGGDLEIGFNAQYLLDFLAAVGTEAVHLELKDADAQGILEPEGESATDYRYVVMPMRL
jgi:DNA polymerase-3 subunit beta